MTVRVEASIELATDPDTAFAAVVDLPAQEKWIIATKLYAIEGEVLIPQVGSRMAAFTGLAGVGFLDTMVVTEYDPPWRWVTAHEGKFVQGVGIFEVEPSLGGCRFTWAEELDLPFGLVGRLGWPLVKPFARLGLQASLRRMAGQLSKGRLASAAAPAAVATPKPV
ncbi:MAG: SRPBCC family protein [Nakamurella sp.]